MLRVIIPLLIALPLVSARAPTTTLEIEVTGLRDHRGMLHACVTRNPAHFPDCRSDSLAAMTSVPSAARTITFRGLEPGQYAVAVFHDSNSNKRLDTFLGIPREGFGFSRNPKLRFGAPRFQDVSFALAPGVARTNVRLQYLL